MSYHMQYPSTDVTHLLLLQLNDTCAFIGRRIIVQLSPYFSLSILCLADAEWRMHDSCSSITQSVSKRRHAGEGDEEDNGESEVIATSIAAVSPASILALNSADITNRLDIV